MFTAHFSPPEQGHWTPSCLAQYTLVYTLLSRDSKASEVEDLELFMPEEAAGRGRARSIPWLPALVTGLQGLAALLMFVKWVYFSVEEKRKICMSTT